MAKTGRRRPGGSDRNVGPRLGLHRPIRPSKSNAGPRELPLPLIRLRGAAGMVGPWGQRRGAVDLGCPLGGTPSAASGGGGGQLRPRLLVGKLRGWRCEPRRPAAVVRPRPPRPPPRRRLRCGARRSQASSARRGQIRKSSRRTSSNLCLIPIAGGLALLGHCPKNSRRTMDQSPLRSRERPTPSWRGHRLLALSVLPQHCLAWRNEFVTQPRRLSVFPASLLACVALPIITFPTHQPRCPGRTATDPGAEGREGREWTEGGGGREGGRTGREGGGENERWVSKLCQKGVGCQQCPSVPRWVCR